MNGEFIGLDFETYSGTDLPKYGLYRYVSDPHFTPLIAVVTYEYNSREFDFITGDFDEEVERLRNVISDKFVVAHNAIFEREVLRAIGIDLPASQFIDSAVIARAMGAAGKLEAAGPQLLGMQKLEQGSSLIKLFSIPGPLQEKNGSRRFDPEIVNLHPQEWADFMHYCNVDSSIGWQIAERYFEFLGVDEHRNMAITMEMNRTGWHVDIELVEEMNRRYLENVEVTVENFRAKHDAGDLNLNSLKQLKEWCEKRGIKAKSFDEKGVATLLKRIDKKLDTLSLSHPRYVDYFEVKKLLETKQILGGSSLKKLQVILDLTAEDGRLRDQYVHIGAGQTWRTTGRSVQMQNLKRLGEDVADMTTVFDLDHPWDNDQLAENLRQVFTASDPNGFLIVGDFSSVEARGLAWLAGQNDTLKAFADGKDLYKVQAASMYGTTYDLVTKPQRQTGKVGVLSCGYQAGAGAVQSFASGMGVELTEGEASNIVSTWRAANPQIVQLWDDLHWALLGVIEDGKDRSVMLQHGFLVVLGQVETPRSLKDQHPKAQSISLKLFAPNGETVLRRVFHGCYPLGRNIHYYKPSELKGGKLWRDKFVNPKTKQEERYNIYGGKLAGILTQSLCREIFFQSLRHMDGALRRYDRRKHLKIVGQFHDEIVLDWSPHGILNIESAKSMLHQSMTYPGIFRGFPLAAEIKHDYRYTK